MAALFMMLFGARQALAGGPTSVLVVSPESKESASLYVSDKAYGRLNDLLGQPGDAQEELPPGLGVGAGRQLNVTWLLHDVQPWRIDRVYPDTPGSAAVWIHTSTSISATYKGYWHKAQRPTELRSLLRALDVMGRRSPGGAPPIFPSRDSSDAQAAQVPGTAVKGANAAASPPAAVSGDTGWGWGLAGLAAGAVAALVLRPLVTHLPKSLASVYRRRERGPRQELRDV
ncbi:hypothetical protein [Streptomyces sp. NPDC049813]|uniref:hypothetical protein n=1 Tax=Streptomyces sp. NPDC049813 TaxID=3365597 RepID=UPI00379329FA